MRRSRLAIASAVLLLVLAAGTAPASARDSHRCVAAGALRFREADGILLAGHRFGGTRANGRTTIVLAHQSDGSLCDWTKGARQLVAAGYFVVAFDFRGYGDSRGSRNSGRFPADYAAAVRTARLLGARKVVLVGASMGGTAALVAGANIRPRVDGVVSLSGPTSYRRLDALRTAPRLTAPALFLAAELDTSFADFPGDARQLYAATGSESKRLEIVPGGRHGINLFETTAAVRRLVDAFARSA
jgi:pimeloyl-ACP methyl ester carboxylesterase